MPFTLAHPAAALPLRSHLGRLGSASALAVGSMVPDLPYFLPLGIDGPESHSLLGILWFDLPVGVAAWLVYALLLRPFGLALLPVAVLRRLDDTAPRPRLSPSRAGRGRDSVTVGAATHVAWDSFTHAPGAAVDFFPLLRTPVPLFTGYTPEVYTLLQHASSLAGLLLLAGGPCAGTADAATPRGRPAPPLPLPPRLLAAAVIVLPTLATLVWVFSRPHERPGHGRLPHRPAVRGRGHLLRRLRLHHDDGGDGGRGPRRAAFAHEGR